MSAISYHPDVPTLSAYAEGTLDPHVALMVAAHVDMCTECQRQVKALEQQLADISLPVLNADVDVGQQGMSSMLASILAQPLPAPVEVPAAAEFVRLGERQFYMPRALQRIAAEANSWRRFGASLWRARLPQSADGAKLSLLFIDHQGEIPCHTHKGSELTLVLDGSFEDDDGRYVCGDLIVRDQRHNHAPRTPDEACLCIALVDAPLHFTQGFGRLLNPFSQLLS